MRSDCVNLEFGLLLSSSAVCALKMGLASSQAVQADLRSWGHCSRFSCSILVAQTMLLGEDLSDVSPPQSIELKILCL